MKYIIAMDFEANFDPQPHEIIEFPAILMDITNGSILSEFHEYVKPTKNPGLSSRCQQLTGISQSTVNRADTLPTVLQSFDRWLTRVTNNYNLVMSSGQINCAFVTWGNDFKQFLIPECQEKGYQVQSYFKRWADLRTTFNSKYGTGNISLEDALRRANLQACGQLHSGFADSKNLANLARKLYIDGYKNYTINCC